MCICICLTSVNKKEDHNGIEIVEMLVFKVKQFICYLIIILYDVSWLSKTFKLNLCFNKISYIKATRLNKLS